VVLAVHATNCHIGKGLRPLITPWARNNSLKHVFDSDIAISSDDRRSDSAIDRSIRKRKRGSNDPVPDGLRCADDGSEEPDQ
jgi:hypothetical protein